MNFVAEEPCIGGRDPKKRQREERNCLSDQCKSIHDLIRGNNVFLCKPEFENMKTYEPDTVTLLFLCMISHYTKY